ncbi:MAG: hypothetical protein ACOX9R_06035 [Armatimonadota bacterium]
MAQRLLISGDNAKAVETIRRMAEERGLTVTALDRDEPLPVTRRPGGDIERSEWTWRDEDEAYKRQLPRLMKEYEGRYVAMYRGEVVGVGDSAKAAAREGIEHLGRPEALTVAKVGEPIPEAVETGLWIDAPRHVVLGE